MGYLFERAELIKHPGQKYRSYDDIIYELSDFVYGDSSTIPSDRIGDYKNGRYFMPDPSNQFKVLFEFIDKLENSLPEEAARKYVSELISIFDERAFSVLGGKAKNPFYNDAKFIAFNTLYVLQKYKIVDSTSIDALTDDFFLGSYQFQNFYSSLDENLIKAYTPADHPRNSQKEFAADTLRKRIKDALDAKNVDLDGDLLTQSKKNLIIEEIEVPISDFDKKTESYWNWYKYFTEGDNDERYLRKKHINTDFLLELVFSNNILPQLQYKSDLDRLFFGDTSANHLYRKFLDQDKDNPDLSTLLNMKFMIYRWSESDFEVLSQKGTFKTEVEVTSQDLRQVKKVLINKIDEYIKSRGYIADEFTRYGVKYSQKDILPEFNFVNAPFDFATELEYFSQLNDKMISKIEIHQSFLKVRRLFGIEGVNLLGDLNKGIFYSPETVEKVMSFVQQRLQEDFGYLYMLSEADLQNGLMTDYEYRLLDLYSNFLSKVGGYASQRGLKLFAPDKAAILNQYDFEKWNDERVKGYGVVFHLCQFLGFDPLFFEPLDKGIFKRGAWLRHHFRDWILRKTSSRVSDTLLTDDKKHGAYKQYSEGFIVALMNGLIEAIQLKKDEISPADLENLLKKHMTKYLNDQGGTTPEGNSVGELVDKVLKIWKQKGDYVFKKRLDKLNKRRTDYIDEKGVFRFDVFLEDKYDMDSESRFVKNARDFHTLLRNDQISGSARDLYVTQQDFDYMQRIFPSAGSSQSRITDWIFIFSTVHSRNINIEWINYLEKQVWKI